MNAHLESNVPLCHKSLSLTVHLPDDLCIKINTVLPCITYFIIQDLHTLLNCLVVIHMLEFLINVSSNVKFSLQFLMEDLCIMHELNFDLKLPAFSNDLVEGLEVH